MNPTHAHAASDALTALAARLREDDTVASPAVMDPSEQPLLGMLAAAGPRAAAAPGDYSLVIESVREGYLLHHETSRLLPDADPDLALLTGDYLYALGIERLSGLADEAAVVELSDLISLCAQVHSDSREELSTPLWIAGSCAVGCGPSASHDAAKEAVREASPGAKALLDTSARDFAEAAGLGRELARVSEAIESSVPRR